MDIKPRQLEILEAAGAILNEESISGLTTKNLARRVGFAESALYRHFGSKEEIIAALLEYLYERMEEHLSPVVQATEMLPAERLRRLFHTHLEFLSENPHFLAAIFSEGMLQYSPAIHERILRLMSLMHKSVMGIIREGQDRREFNDRIPAEELTYIMMGSFRLLMLRWRISGLDFDVVKAGKQHVGYLISLILK